VASPGNNEVSLNGGLELEYEPVDPDIGEGSGILKLSDRDPIDLPCGPGGESIL